MKGKVGFDSLAALAMERGQAGWKLNSSYTPGDDTTLIPRFRPFLETDLNGADVNAASAKAGEIKVQYDLLARAIPALSYAAAVDLIPALGPAESESNRNFDLEQFGRGAEWPTEDHGGEAAGDWIHSDFKDVALPYVTPMYKALIDKGYLNEN